MAFFGYKDMDKLSDVDLAIYRYIVSHDEKVPYMRVRELAAGACVSNSSVMRFIRKIGYDSFPEFKVSLKSELKTGEQPSDELPLVTMEAFSDDLLRLIKIVGGILLEADNIFLVGMGASGAIAEYASRQLSALCFNSSAVKDPYYPLSSQLKNTTNNVIITLSVSGKTPELIEMLNNFVNDPDTTLVTITGNLESPLARMGRYALTYNIEESRIHQYYDMTVKATCDALAKTGVTDVIVIGPSLGISGLVNTLAAYVENITSVHVWPWDSRGILTTMGDQVRLAAELVAKGHSVREVFAQLSKLRATAHSVFVVDSIKPLLRTGEVNPSHSPGSTPLLAGKPILIFDPSGKMRVAGSALRLKGAMSDFLDDLADDLAGADPVKATVLNADQPEATQRWIAGAQKRFPTVKFDVALIGPSFGVHVGDGAMGLAWCQDYRSLLTPDPNVSEL